MSAAARVGVPRARSLHGGGGKCILANCLMPPRRCMSPLLADFVEKGGELSGTRALGEEGQLDEAPAPGREALHLYQRHSANATEPTGHAELTWRR
jgi:hypothetical protein